MENIKITSDEKEMIAIAKAIVEEKKAVYSAGYFKRVTDEIERRFPGITAEN